MRACVTLLVLFVAAGVTAQVGTLPRGATLVRAAEPTIWASAAGPVEVSMRASDHRVTLRFVHGGAVVEHAFEDPHWGAPLFVRYGTWRDDVLGLRIFERAPSLGWPRFVACARIEVREGRLLLFTEEPTGAHEDECAIWRP